MENVAEVTDSNKGVCSDVDLGRTVAHRSRIQLEKTILVPLTNSLYVPGRLSNPDSVIVDVGTGYYVKKV